MTNRGLCGEYHLLGRLNTGGMAEVFLARHVQAKTGSKLIAIKRMLPRFMENAEFAQMFRDEARIASKLRHPNICRVFDQGSHENQLYIAMEFVHGKDLRVVYERARERGERIPYAVAVFVLAMVADALEHAHCLRNEDGGLENLVHRDVSPQNIVIGYDGVPRLIDFGIARVRSKIAQTQVGVLKGKSAYMSPEQALAKPMDNRSDVWALGVVLYHILTGELPFKGASAIDTLRRVASGQSVPITEIAPNTPKPLVEIIERAMQPKASDRFQTAGLFADACRDFALTNGRMVDTDLMAAYMRRLFKAEYVHESERIRQLQDGEAAQAAKAVRSSDEDTMTLAAGYHVKYLDSEITELAEIEIEEPESIEEPLGELVFRGLESGAFLSEGELVGSEELTEPSGPSGPEIRADDPTVPMFPLTEQRGAPPRRSTSDFAWLTAAQAGWLMGLMLLGAGTVGLTYLYALTVPLTSIVD